MPTKREQMLSGDWYRGSDDELGAMAQRTCGLMAVINDPTTPWERVGQAIGELLGSRGDRVVVRPPFHVDYGDFISIGSDTFVNFGATMLDCAPITIGEACQIATGVQLLTPDHPRDPVRRREGWERAFPITIGDNVWLGGGAIVGPGVTIGDDAIVGAGAVVVKDVPAGATVVGSPARPVR
jgi:maltose O-acetyltransferase